MHVYLKDQLVFLVASFFAGVFLSLLYDVFRVLRVSRGNRYAGGLSPERVASKLKLLSRYNSYSERRSKKKQMQKTEYILVAAEDVFYSLLLVLTVQVLVFGGNYGIPRFFSFFGIIVGFFISRVTIGKLIMLLSEYITYFAGAVIYYLLLPFYFLVLKIKKMIYKFKNMIYNRYVRARICKNSKIELSNVKKMLINFCDNI